MIMKTQEPTGTVGKRKNLRGLWSHLQALVDRLVRDEFPALAPVQIETHVMGPVHDTALAHWFQCEFEPGRTMRQINFNMEDARALFLEADDEELKDLIRHELLHGELRRQGLPWHDDDIPFIMECLRRRLSVNDASIRAFEAQYGRGSFDVFRLTLPEPEREEVPLAAGAGCWLKVKEKRDA